MKTTLPGKLLPILALVALSACGQDESAQEAATDTPVAEQSADYRFNAGEHFERFDPPQPTLVDDATQIEVAEVFWYGCHHCANLEAPLKSWVAEAPESVRFVRIPATWNQIAITHAQMFYTLEALTSNGAITDFEAVHAGVFEAIHRQGNRLNRVEQVQAFFAEFGVESDTFNDAWNSPEVAEALRRANELARNYRIDAVPTIVVSGEYKTSAYLAGNDLFSVVDELIERQEAAL